MRYFYDCEFLEDGRTIELISIGIVCEDGREYYAVNAEMPIDRIKGHDWLMRNVMPTLPVTGRNSLDAYIAQSPNHFPRPSITMVDIDRTVTCVKPSRVIANEVRDFLLADDESNHDRELWAYYSAYDHVALCQLWGTMMNLPDGIPMWTHDLMQAWEQAGRPEKPSQKGEHNALEDARWNRALYLATEQPGGNQ